MTRKRYIKLLMADGFSLRNARLTSVLDCLRYGSYKQAYAKIHNPTGPDIASTYPSIFSNGMSRALKETSCALLIAIFNADDNSLKDAVNAMHGLTAAMSAIDYAIWMVDNGI